MASSSAVLALIRTARPALRNAADAVAFFVHAALACEGFVLVATGEAAQRDVGNARVCEASVDGWNALADEYAFRYVSEAVFPSGGKQYQLKALAVGSKLLVDVATSSQEPAAHLELRVSDFTTGRFEGDYTGMYCNAGALLSKIQAAVAHALGQLPPGVSQQGPGRVDATEQAGDRYGDRASTAQPGNLWQPALGGVGDQDRFPHGMPNIPVLGPFGPGTGGGMLVGPDYPGFFSGGREPPGHGAGPRPPGVPPGARFDPFGPPGIPGFEPGRFGGERRGQGVGIPSMPPVLHPDVMQPGPDDDSIM